MTKVAEINGYGVWTRDHKTYVVAVGEYSQEIHKFKTISEAHCFLETFQHKF